MRLTTIGALALVASLVAAPPAAAQVSPDRLATIAKTVHDAERYDLGGGSTREYRNAYWARVVGIVHFGHPVYNPTPDPSWCIKDAGNGRPQTDDVGVKCATREFWDFIGGVGANGYTFRANGHPGERLSAEQNVYPPPRPSDAGPVVPPPTPGPSAWTAQHGELLARLGRPSGTLDPAFVQRVAEQFAYTFGPDWGRKSADPSRPLSGDILAKRDGARLLGYRIVPATSTPEQLDITGQTFSGVAGIDHLGLGTEPQPPEPPPVQAPVEPPVEPPPATPSPDLQAILDAIAALAARLEALAAEPLCFDGKVPKAFGGSAIVQFCRTPQ